MCPDLPRDLNKLKEEEEPLHYDPPYEDNQGDQHRTHTLPKTGQEFDFTLKAEERNPDLPDVVKDESPAGELDLRGQAGEQGDDDLKGFRASRENPA